MHAHHRSRDPELAGRFCGRTHGPVGTVRHAAPDGSKPDWGAREVVISPLVYWLNRGLAKKRGIEFSPAALHGAREVYD